MAERGPAVVRRVRVQRPGRLELLAVADFMALTHVERTRLILEKKVEFLDDADRPVPLLEGVRYLNSI